MFKDKYDVCHLLLCKTNIRYIRDKLSTQGPMAAIDKFRQVSIGSWKGKGKVKVPVVSIALAVQLCGR